MSDHDAASVIGQMAGLAGQPAHLPVTPQQLIERFCDPARTQRIHTGRYTVHHGFCGLTYIGESDLLRSGFDDGYAFLGYLQERGWQALYEKGDWPYVVYLRFTGDPLAVVQYLECDFTAWVLDDPDAFADLFLRLSDAP